MAPQSLLILTALAQEEQALIRRLESTRGVAPAIEELDACLGLRMTRANLGNRSIAIVRTGVGSVNAAMALLLAQARMRAAGSPCDAVVLLGVGGALARDLDVGDFVISSRVLAHDYYYSFDHGDQRIRPGALILSSEEAQGNIAHFDADTGLVEWLRAAEASHRSAPTREQILVGSVLSGNEFVGRVERKLAVAALMSDALLVEMEAAGVAQVADRLGIPFVVGKTVADRLSPDGSIENDFRVCLDAASEHAAAVLGALL